MAGADDISTLLVEFGRIIEKIDHITTDADDRALMKAHRFIAQAATALAERDAQIERLTRDCADFSRFHQDARARATTAERDLAEARARNVELQVLAHGWMVAHDMLKAGEPYDIPRPTDLPDAIKDLAEARAEVEQVRKIISPMVRCWRDGDDISLSDYELFRAALTKGGENGDA